MNIHGTLHVSAFKRGRLIWEIRKPNLKVTAALVPVAKLLGGDVANQPIAAVGFGSGVGAPALGDTQLTAPAYYKAIDSHSYPVAGQVSFAWSLGSGDAAADGLVITEMGLFCNTGAISLPVYESSATPSMTLFARILLSLGTFDHSTMNFSATWTETVS